MNLWPIFDELMRGMAVLLMLGGGVMLFVATDHAIQQVYRHSLDHELDYMRERDGESEKK